MKGRWKGRMMRRRKEKEEKKPERRNKGALEVGDGKGRKEV